LKTHNHEAAKNRRSCGMITKQGWITSSMYTAHNSLPTDTHTALIAKLKLKKMNCLAIYNAYDD